MGSKFKGDTNMWLNLVKEMSGSKRGGGEPIEEYQTKGEVKDFGSNITFDEAFAKARELGLEIFKWDGKEYGTKTESEYYPNLLPEIEIEAIGPETMAGMTDTEHKLVSMFQTPEGTIGQLPYTSKESLYNFKSPKHEAEYNAAMEDGTMNPADMASYFDLSDMFIQENEFGLSELDLLNMYRAAGSPNIHHIDKGDRAHYDVERSVNINEMFNLDFEELKDKNIEVPHAINIQNSEAGKEEQLKETIEELAHAYQYTTESDQSWIEGDNFMNVLNMGISEDEDGYRAYDIVLPDSSEGMCYDASGNEKTCGRYSFPGHQEHIAHSMIARGLASEFASIDHGATSVDADETGQQNYYIKDIDGNIRQGRYVMIPKGDDWYVVKEEYIPSNYTIDDFMFVGEMNGHQLGFPKGSNLDKYIKKKYGGSLPKYQNTGEHYVGDGHDHSHDDLLKNVSTEKFSTLNRDPLNNEEITDGMGNVYNVIDNEVVLNQDSRVKTWLTDDIKSEGYDARWKRELAKNKELGNFVDTESYNFADGIGGGLGKHTKEFRLDNLANTKEYLGRPRDYKNEGLLWDYKMGNKYFETTGGVMMPSNKKNKYPRIYYGSDMKGDIDMPLGSTFSMLRRHELTHAATNSNEGLTPYALDLLKKAKTSEESGDYLTNPTETYARYKVAQKMMQDKGIFNSFTDTEFTEENYDKLQEYLNSEEFRKLDDYNDIKEFFGDDGYDGTEFNKKISKEHIMEIMNNVADNSGVGGDGEIGGDDLQQGINAKYGGSLQKFQTLGEHEVPTDIINANKEVDVWNKEYVLSDNYRDMLQRAGLNENEIQSRINAVLNFNVDSDITFDENNPAMGSMYNTATTRSDGWNMPMTTFPGEGNDMINYNPGMMEGHTMYGPPNEGGGWPAVSSHEQGHLLGPGGLNKKTTKALKNIAKENKRYLKDFAGGNKSAYKHAKDPEEMRANLLQLRYQMEAAGLYKSTEGNVEERPFTEEDFKKIANFDEDGNFKGYKSEFNNELLQTIPPQDIIWMMNNIAMNQEIGDDLSEGTMRAKYGGQLPKAQIGKETVDPSRTNYSDSKNYQRIKNTRDGVRENEDGSHSTHLMADNNKDEAWPTLFQDVNGEWFEPLDAYQEAKLRDEVYKFSTRQAMINFARKGEWKTDVKDIKTFSDSKSMYKTGQYSKGAKAYRRGGEVLPKFQTTGEVTSENIVSTDPTTITGKKRKEESYTGEWYEGPYVDYGIEDLFNFQEGKYKDGIDLVEAGKWRSARGFTATDLQYWYYYTQNNIPYGHTKECRENGTCLNDDGINPLININQRSTWDGKNYGFVRQDLTGVSDGTLDPKANDFGWVPKNHTHAHAMARDMRSILGILFFWNGEPYTNEDPTEKGLRTGTVQGKAIIDFENKISNAKSKQEVLEIIKNFKPDINAQRIMYNKTNPFNLNPDQHNAIMNIRQKHFGDLDMSQTKNYRIAGPVVVNHKERIKILQTILDDFPHPDMEDWNNRDHIKWPWKTMNDDGTYSWQSIWKNGSLEYLYQKERGMDVSLWEKNPVFMKRLNYYQDLINFYTEELTKENPNPEFPHHNENLPYEGQTWQNQGQWDTYDKGRQKEQALMAEKGVKFFNPETFVKGKPTEWWDFQNKKWVKIGMELQKFDTEEFKNFKTETISYLLKTGRLEDVTMGDGKVDQYIKYLYSGVNTYWANEIFDLVDQDLPQFSTKKDKDAFLKTHAFKNHEFNDLSYIDENGDIVKTEDQYIPYMTMYNKTQLYSNGDPFTMIDTPEKALMANQFNLISGPYSKNLLGFKTKWAGFGFDLEKVPHYMPWLKRFAYDELVPGTENEYVRKYVDNPEYNKDTGKWSANAANWIAALGPKGDGQDGYLLNDYNQSDWKNILDFTDTEAMFGYKEDENGKMIMRAGTFNLGQYNDGHFANEMIQGHGLDKMRSDLKGSPFPVDDKVNTSETNAGELSLWGMGAYSAYQLWNRNPIGFGTNLGLREYAKRIALQPIKWAGNQFNNSFFLNSSLGSIPGLTSGTSGLTLNNAMFTGFGYYHGTEAIDHYNKGEYGEAAYDAAFTGLNVLPAYNYFNKSISLFPESQSFIKNSKLFAENELFSNSSKFRTDFFNQNAYRPWNYKANQINTLPAISFNNRLISTFPKATDYYNKSKWLPGSFTTSPSQYSIMSNANKPGGLFPGSPQGSLNYQFKIDSPLFRNYKSSNYDFLGRFNPQFNPKPLQIGRDHLQLGYNNQPMYMMNADGTRNWNWRMDNITNPGYKGFTMPNKFEKGMYYRSFDNMVKPVDGGYIIK